jgi:acyl-CoA thioesterase
MSASPAHTLAQQCADALWETDRASQALGMKVESIAPGSASLSMIVRPDMAGRDDACSRGAIFLLADSALAFATNTYGHRAVAQYCDIAFDNPVAVGEEIVADASERHMSGRRGVYDVRVRTRTGEVVAEMRGHTHALRERLIEPEGQRDP